MRKLAWVIAVGSLYMCSSVQASDDIREYERQALENALLLVGPTFAGLPIILTSALPRAVSPVAEAWTVYDESGKPDKIFVYTRSEIFRCASEPHREVRQCILKLASIVVHEAWHLRNGPDEAGAYQAQLTFLQLNDGSAAQISAVRISRDRVLAAARKATKATSERLKAPETAGLRLGLPVQNQCDGGRGRRLHDRGQQESLVIGSDHVLWGQR
jgi:hypothetical protein